MIWESMLSIGAGTPSNRQRRQAYGGYGVLQQQSPSTSNLFTAIVATGPLKVELGSFCSRLLDLDYGKIVSVSEIFVLVIL